MPELLFSNDAVVILVHHFEEVCELRQELFVLLQLEVQDDFEEFRVLEPVVLFDLPCFEFFFAAHLPVHHRLLLGGHLEAHGVVFFFVPPQFDAVQKPL